MLTNLRSLGGLGNLPFDLQRRLLTHLVEEIILDTKECWFEFRGTLSEIHGVEHSQFAYDNKGQLVSMSARRSGGR
jgi:hypothetical protein